MQTDYLLGHGLEPLVSDAAPRSLTPPGGAPAVKRFLEQPRKLLQWALLAERAVCPVHTPPEHVLRDRRVDQVKLMGAEQPIEAFGPHASAKATNPLVSEPPHEHRRGQVSRARFVQRDRSVRPDLGERPHVAEHKIDLGALLEHAQARGDADLRQQVVSVKQDDHVSAYRLDRPAARRAHAQMRLADNVHRRSKRRRNRGATVGGPVVNDDDIGERNALAEHAA